MDLKGKQFGSLLVIMRVNSEWNCSAWACRCTCGNIVKVRGECLVRKKQPTLSCGCIRSARIGALRRSHQMSETRLYSIWRNMKTRCLNPNSTDYKNYGGRGISVCPRWVDDFAAFAKDIGPAPDPSLTLDRIDNDGHYEPGNCRWATRKQQAENKRRAKKKVLAGSVVVAR